MVVVNLYPFEKVVTETVLDEKDLLEYIDIGGVTLLRAAGKNFHEALGSYTQFAVLLFVGVQVSAPCRQATIISVWIVQGTPPAQLEFR